MCPLLTEERQRTDIVENIPNAAKLISSLRHLDYDNLTAVADLIDNSIDAESTGIWIDILSDSADVITGIRVIDNGKGMDRETLDEALKLGSDIKKNKSSELGFYGMGLITASISMGSTLTVLTKAIDETTVLESVQDLDQVIKANKFIKSLGVANDIRRSRWEKSVLGKQKLLPKKIIRNHGTVVSIDNIDNCHYKGKELKDKLHQHIGRIYRKFLRTNKVKIFIDDIEVAISDPIFDFHPEILHEEDIVLPKGTIHLLIAELKDEGQTINRAKGYSIDKEGFYVLRNDREILSAQTLDLFNKRHELNCLRMEFSFPGSLDDVLSSNFSKSKILLNNELRRKIGQIIYPFIKQLKKKREDLWSSKQHNNFNSIEKLITQRSHLLKLPPGLKKTETSGKEGNENKQGSKEKKARIRCGIERGEARLDIKRNKRVKLDQLKVEFRYLKLTDKGPVYTADKEKDKVIVNWNTDHLFYKVFIHKYQKNHDVLTPVSCLVYAFANAELIAEPDSDSLEIIENIRYDVARNLAVLLK